MIRFRLSQDILLNLEGSPSEFSDFQSPLGFPIFSLSFPTTKFFFLFLIIRGTLLRAFL